jgi:hypothetical protein
MLEDIAILSGGKLISEDIGVKLESVKWEDLGEAKRITIDKDNTTLVTGTHDNARKEAIASRVKQIRAQIEDTTSDYDRRPHTHHRSPDLRDQGRERRRRRNPAAGMGARDLDAAVGRHHARRAEVVEVILEPRPQRGQSYRRRGVRARAHGHIPLRGPANAVTAAWMGVTGRHFEERSADPERPRVRRVTSATGAPVTTGACAPILHGYSDL